jgi:hypothetical protein
LYTGGVIPDFTDAGALPPGEWQTNLDEIEEKLAWSGRRRELLAGLRKALSLMGSCGVERVYLDGSFVTDKDRPGDIDGCYDLAADATEEDLRRLEPIWPPNPWNRAEAKDRFGVDFFPAATEELGSGMPFKRFFKRDREGRERGVLVVELPKEQTSE